MWPAGYQSEEWICSLNSLNICPVLLSWFVSSILSTGSVAMGYRWLLSGVGWYLPIGVREMQVQVHSSVMRVWEGVAIFRYWDVMEVR